MDSAELFKFLSRPRTIKEVSRRFGLTLSDVEQILSEIPESRSVVVDEEHLQDSPRMLTRSREFLASFARSSASRKTVGMPKVRSRIRGKDQSWSRNDRLHFKFKELGPSVVKTARPAALLTDIFKSNTGERYQSRPQVSLPLEARLLSSLTIGPKTMMDLRAGLGVSRRNIGSLERKGFVESFWGPKGVGRIFRITRKGSIELMRLKIVSSIDRKVIEKPRISMRRITPPVIGLS